MKVYFDVTSLMPERLSGIGVYTRELFLALKTQKADIEPVTKLSRVLKQSAVQKHIKQKERSFLGVIESLKGPSIIQGPDFKLLSHSSRFKKIVTIHDLAVFHKGFNDEKFREQGQRATRQVLEKGQPDIVIADTHVIADEIREHFPEFCDRVRCISPGCDHLVGASPKKQTQKAPYFLYAGHLETRKNVIGIVKAFEHIASKHKDARLVLVGKDGYQADDIRRSIESSDAKQAIELKGFVSDKELQSLYASATAFVFPSFYEGFGFPILEAMSLGCPVITSDRGAMAELAGDAALLVDPYNHEHIAAAMESLLTEPTLVEKLMSAGEQRFPKFTWQQSAESFLALYSQL